MGLLALLVATYFFCLINADGLHPRIVGGTVAELGEFPAQIALLYHGGQYCGGTIIHEEWVVTAAHCFYRSGRQNIHASDLSVRYGAVDIRSGSTQGGEVSVHSLHISPIYNDHNTNNDIALLRLATPLVLDENTNTAALPSADPAIDDTCILTGFGSTNQRGTGLSPDLRKVTTKVRENDECNANYGGHTVFPGMICTGIRGVSGRDSCVGDSGGPVWVEGAGGELVLVGISSFGGSYTTTCGDPDRWAVNTRVHSYVDWVESTLAASGHSVRYAAPTSSGGSASSTTGSSTTTASTSTTAGATSATTTGAATTTGDTSSTSSSTSGQATSTSTTSSTTAATTGAVLSTHSREMVVVLEGDVHQFNPVFFAHAVADHLGISVERVNVRTYQKGDRSGVFEVYVDIADEEGGTTGEEELARLPELVGQEVGEWKVVSAEIVDQSPSPVSGDSKVQDNVRTIIVVAAVAAGVCFCCNVIVWIACTYCRPGALANDGDLLHTKQDEEASQDYSSYDLDGILTADPSPGRGTGGEAGRSTVSSAPPVDGSGGGSSSSVVEEDGDEGEVSAALVPND